jgi:phosphatidylinositol-bisphosphatase
VNNFFTLEISRQQKFVLLRSYQLVGIVLSLFVREDYVPFIREVHSEIVKVGFKGIAGNKGAISMRFNFHASSFCFTCAHFAAGSSNVEERNANYHEIMNNTMFRTSKGTYGIMDHEYAFSFIS